MNNINNETKNVKNDEKKGDDEVTIVYDLNYILSTKEGQFAKFMAEGLDDMKNIRYYISIALEHSEKFLRGIYRKVKETPQWKIKKSRGALFAYLVKRYEKLDDYES